MWISCEIGSKCSCYLNCANFVIGWKVEKGWNCYKTYFILYIQSFQHFRKTHILPMIAPFMASPLYGSLVPFYWWLWGWWWDYTVKRGKDKCRYFSVKCWLKCELVIPAIDFRNLNRIDVNYWSCSCMFCWTITILFWCFLWDSTSPTLFHPI